MGFETDYTMIRVTEPHNYETSLWDLKLDLPNKIVYFSAL